MNNNRHNGIRRAGFAGLVLAAFVTILGVSPSGATEVSKPTATTWTLDYAQPNFTLYDLATARISRVGITPIPIP